MASISILHGLPFVRVTVGANGRTINLDNILFDTGSGSTIFKTDDLAQLGIAWQLTDELRYTRGIGGLEAVVEKQVDFVELGDLRSASLIVEMGAVDYGFSINGILGMNFITQINAVIDFKAMEIRKG